MYKREFSWLSCISFAFSISGLFASVATTYSYPLYAGGAASAVWSWLISGFGCMCIALSVSEICSAYPTSGGMYFTLKYLAPDRWVPEISWLCGWLTVIGQIAGLASTEFGTAQLVLAAVAIGTNFDYIPTTNQTVGVMAGLLILHGTLNSLSTRWLERITRGYVIFHLAVLISCAITLLVMTKDKHSTTYVWTDVTPSTGWSPAGFSFLFGFLAVSWTMTDYDATAHIAEEIKDPAIKAPWAITTALGFTWIGGWLFTIVLTYCCGDIASILDSPIEQPVAQIFYNVMGHRAAAFFTACAAVILNFTGMTGMQSGARAVWAVARDEMLPGSRIWVKINSKTHTPIWAVWLVTVACICINLIALGSYLAIAAIFSMTAIAFDWSYCIPIICKMLFGRFEPGPFHLGKFSFIINFWAVAWTAFVSVVFIFPGYKPVTAENVSTDTKIKEDQTNICVR